MFRMILVPEDDYKTLQDRLNKIGEKGYMLEDIYFTRLFKFSKTDKPVHYLVDFNLEEFKKKTPYSMPKNSEIKKYRKNGWDYRNHFLKFNIFTTNKDRPLEREKQTKKDEAIKTIFSKRYRNNVIAWAMMFGFILFSFFMFKLSKADMIIVVSFASIFALLSLFNWIHVTRETKNTLYYPICVLAGIITWFTIAISLYFIK